MFCENLKKKRIERGFTQVEFSEKLNINQSYFSRIENGMHIPSIDLIKKWLMCWDVRLMNLCDKKKEGAKGNDD